MNPLTPAELLAASKRRIQVSDHFLTQTYPSLQEPKLLINVLQGIMQALTGMMDATLHHERAKGTIPAYNETSLAAKLQLLHREPIGPRYNISQIDTQMIAELNELLEKHQEAAVIFARRGALVSADDNFVLRTITPERAKTYLQRAKTLYTKIHDNFTRDTELVA